MKYIIYTIYAVTVLLFSGFARAATLMGTEQPFQSSATILEVGVSQTLDLEVTGYVPTPCHQNPTAMLVPDNNNPYTLILRLVSPTHANFCVQRLKDFTTVVSLRQLAAASQLPLEDGAAYVVKTDGHDFAIEVLGHDLKN